MKHPGDEPIKLPLDDEDWYVPRRNDDDEDDDGAPGERWIGVTILVVMILTALCSLTGLVIGLVALTK